MKMKFSVGWIAGALIAAMMVFAHHASAAAPNYQAAGGPAGSTGTPIPTPWPAHQTNDIGLLVVETQNQAATLTTNAADWTQVTNSPQGTGATNAAGATRLTVWWSRATSASMGAVQVVDSGDHTRSEILTFRGVITSGNPWDATPAGDVAATASTAVSIPGATTTVANTLVVTIVVNSRDANVATEASVWTNANLSDLTGRAGSNSAIGGGGGYSLATGVKVAAGAYGATTATLATSSLQGRMSIALRPPACGVISDLSHVSASSATSGPPHSVTLTFPSSEVIVLRKTSAFTGSDAPLYTYASTFTLAGGPNGTDLISNSASPITSVTDNNNGSGLTAGTKYFYKVIAKAGSCYGPGAVGQTEVSTAPGVTGVAWNYGMSGGSMLKPGIAGQGAIYPSSNAGRIIALNTTTGAPSWSPLASTGAQSLQGWLTWVPLKAQVTFEEVETGGSSGSLTIVTASPLTAVTDHLYLASVVTTLSGGTAPTVSSVSGLGLTWTLVKSQCSTGDTNRRIEVWKAQGTPSGDGTVTANLASPTPTNAAIAVARYSGVDTTNPIGNSTSANVNGTNGVCTGTATSSSYTVNLTTTAANSVAFGAVEKGVIGPGLVSPTAPATLRGNVDQGSATLAGIAIQDKTVATAGTVAVDGTTTVGTYLAVVAVEIKASTSTAITTNAIIGGDQGGKVYAVVASTGAKIWTEHPTGAFPIQAGVAVQLRAYSNATFQSTYASPATDIIFAASMNGASTTTNKLFAIRAVDGTLAWAFNGSVAQTGGMGEITGMPYVDYARNKVYVATKSSTQSRTLWVINSLNGNPVACNGTDCNLGILDSSPTLSYDGNTLYVGSAANPGTLYALNANTLALKWSFALGSGAGNGSVRGFVWEDYSTAGRLYFTTTTGKIMCVQDGGTSAAVCADWPAMATPYSRSLGTGFFGSTLILLDKLFVGSTDGKVHQINPTSGAEDKFFPASGTLDGGATVGDASSETGNEIFVGTDSGKIFKINLVSGALP